MRLIPATTPPTPLLSAGAARLAEEESLSSGERFALAEGVRAALGMPTAGSPTAASDRMLYAAVMAVGRTIQDEVEEAVSLSVDALFGAPPPCGIREAVLATIGSDDDGDDLGPMTVDMAEWHRALANLAADLAGDWEMRETLLRMPPDRRVEAEQILGIPDGYFDVPAPTGAQQVVADRFLEWLGRDSRIGGN